MPLSFDEPRERGYSPRRHDVVASVVVLGSSPYHTDSFSQAQFVDGDGQKLTPPLERFQQGAVTDYRDVRPDWKEEDFVELGLLEMVAKLYPDLFGELDTFCQRYAGYLDETVALADREFGFYLSYLAYIRPLREAGLPFSYPRMSVESKDEQALATFDVALAGQLIGHGKHVVCNDITLSGPERILVISGPNNGGKTTETRPPLLWLPTSCRAPTCTASTQATARALRAQGRYLRDWPPCPSSHPATSRRTLPQTKPQVVRWSPSWTDSARSWAPPSGPSYDGTTCSMPRPRYWSAMLVPGSTCTAAPRTRTGPPGPTTPPRAGC